MASCQAQGALAPSICNGPGHAPLQPSKVQRRAAPSICNDCGDTPRQAG